MLRGEGLGFVALMLTLTLGAARLERVEYDYDRYHPMEEISAWMVQMEKDHPDLREGDKPQEGEEGVGANANALAKSTLGRQSPSEGKDDTNWGTECFSVGVSSNCSSNTYCGSGAISEPEAQALTYFLGSRKEDFLCFLTIHSYGQLLLVPYGHPNFTAPNYNELMEVGLQAAEAIYRVHGRRYTVGSSPDVLYPNSGSSRDWARLQGVPLSFTFELRDNGTFGFLLPEGQIRPACEEAFSGALHILQYAHAQAFSRAV
ncbi:unnamed protein product [Menidia menidia]|uniref:(Atlantic silverside) hypothetical protein n=1 Tax=Menidia menidia TaxID=238744 RepID=A0A8S4BPR4_9TELE|nr:unnamed protein product [Menidia menidia]